LAVSKKCNFCFSRISSLIKDDDGGVNVEVAEKKGAEEVHMIQFINLGEKEIRTDASDVLALSCSYCFVRLLMLL
jgi:hypothetical protein